MTRDRSTLNDDKAGEHGIFAHDSEYEHMNAPDDFHELSTL